ncbi:DUF4232 domain-containing protein [Kitasatospora sp. NPDC089797]|uniref:DUF4232 domain-containing protein n=1 Tax=Kitasatospora sp. NPDC089797 TaxID=3155298 RepID=UPI00342AFAAA
MSVRTSRTRLLVTAASVALAAFSMTACTDKGDIATATGPSLKAAGSGSPTAPAPSAAASGDGGSGGSTSADAGRAPSAAPRTTAPKAPVAIPVPRTTAPSAAAEPVTCEGSNTRAVAAPLNRPVNHMLLTVTNTGSRPCFLYAYPALRFGEAQAVPPVIEESKPQAVVTLRPGESGYVSVNLSSTDGSNGAHGRTETSLELYFHGRSGNESVGAGAHPALPAKGVYIDDSLKVTYWQQSMDDATSW